MPITSDFTRALISFEIKRTSKPLSFSTIAVIIFDYRNSPEGEGDFTMFPLGRLCKRTLRSLHYQAVILIMCSSPSQHIKMAYNFSAVKSLLRRLSFKPIKLFKNHNRNCYHAVFKAKDRILDHAIKHWYLRINFLMPSAIMNNRFFYSQFFYYNTFFQKRK